LDPSGIRLLLIRLQTAGDQVASGLPFTEAEDVAVRIFDVKIQAGPRLFFKRLDQLSATVFKLAEQSADAGDGDVRVQMFVLFPVLSFTREFRRALEMDGESVTADAGVKAFIHKIEIEAKLVTVVGNGPVKIVDQKLRRYSGNARCRVQCSCRHSNSLTARACQLSRSLPCPGCAHVGPASSETWSDGRKKQRSSACIRKMSPTQLSPG